MTRTADGKNDLSHNLGLLRWVIRIQRRRVVYFVIFKGKPTQVNEAKMCKWKKMGKNVH